MRSLIKDSKGQSLTEFALLLPVFLLVVLGVLSLGFLIYAKMLVVISSSEAARVGSQILNDPEYTIEQKHNRIKETALSFLTNGISGTDNNVVITTDGEIIRVKVTYNYTLIFPFLSDIFQDKTSIPISYQSQYVIQNMD